MADPGIALQIGSLTIRWYGLLICGAMALAGVIGYFECKRQHIDVDEAVNLVLVGLPTVILGARFYYVAMTWDYFSQHPEDILKIWEGGMAIHGAIIGAIILAIIYCRVRKQDIWQWGDLTVPLAALGQGIGRWGNYFNQEIYGAVTDVPWAIYVDGAYRHPLFLYESIIDILLFVVLFRMLRRPHKKGMILGLYLLCYSAARFVLEGMRLPEYCLWLGPLRVAQLVSLIGVVAGVIVIVLRSRQPLTDFNTLPPDVMTITKPPKKERKK